MRRSLFFLISLFLSGCGPSQPHITVGSKFFTEQIILAELLAQHIEARTGIHVDRKSNLGGTLLCQKALLSGELDLYVEYTGTALTAVLNESPSDNSDAHAVYERVKQGYAQRFNLDVTEPLGFENTFAMVVSGADAEQFHLTKISDIVPIAPRWRAGVGYEFLERPDGYRGFVQRYGLHFSETPSVMDLGLIYRALVDKKVDIVAGNSTDGLIDALHLVGLSDDRHYFPPVRRRPDRPPRHARKIPAAPRGPRRPCRKNLRRRHAPHERRSRRRPARPRRRSPRLPRLQKPLARSRPGKIM